MTQIQINAASRLKAIGSPVTAAPLDRKELQAWNDAYSEIASQLAGTKKLSDIDLRDTLISYAEGNPMIWDKYRKDRAGKQAAAEEFLHNHRPFTIDWK